MDQLYALRDAGTGFIVNFTHLGDYEGISPSLARAGIPNANVATSEAFDPNAPRVDEAGNARLSHLTARSRCSTWQSARPGFGKR